MRHLRQENPGVAKFGIALEWGSRGPEFESQHSDQAGADVVHLLQLFFVTVGAGSACGPAVPNRTDAAGPRMESLLCSNENIF